MYFCPGQSSIQ